MAQGFHRLRPSGCLARGAVSDTFAEHAEAVAESFRSNLTDCEETGGVIGRSSKAVEQLQERVEEIDEIVEVINDIAEQAEQTVTEIEDVADANEKQATRVREINESVQQLPRE